jgi:ligand-binding sensor domain-containing protein
MLTEKNGQRFYPFNFIFPEGTYCYIFMILFMGINMNLLFGLFLSLNLCFSLNAQVLNSIDWKNYLTNNNVNCIVKENDSLWLGTTGGLIKFNPFDLSHIIYTKENSELPHHNITSIAIDSIGNKWLGTRGGGVIKFDGLKWQVYNQKNTPLSNDFINSVSIDSAGNLWVALEYASIFRYDGNNWYDYYDSAGFPPIGLFDVKYICVDRTNTVWFPSHIGITKYDGNIWERFTPDNSGVPSYKIQTIFVDDSNYVWIGTLENGIAKYDRQNWSSYTDGAFANVALCLSRDEEGNVWIGTHNYGVIKFDYYSWTTYFDAPLPSDRINSIFVTSENKKWIGTELGFTSFNNQIWTNHEFTHNNLFSNEIVSLCYDSNNIIYIGTKYWGHYIFKFKGDEFSNFASGLVDPMELEISYNDQLWAAGYGSGAGVYNQSNWTFYNNGNSGLSNNYIFCIYPDGDSLIWFGTWGGLFKFDGIGWTSYNKDNSPLTSNTIMTITRDHNSNLWIGLFPELMSGQDGGVFKFDGSAWTRYHYNNSGLPSNSVRKIIVDSNNTKWFATQPFPAGFVDLGGGIASFSQDNIWTVYDTTNSKLETNWVTDIALDLDESIWITTKPEWKHVAFQSNYYGGGIYRFDNYSWNYFSTNNSLLPDNHVTSIDVDTYGNKWIGTVNGLSVYNKSGIVTFIEEENTNFNSNNFNLSQNYPNPFNPSTIINYSLIEAGIVSIKVYDILGSEVATLVNETKPAGTYEVEFNASQLPSGVYIYRMSVGSSGKAGGYTASKKILLVK